MFCCTHSTAHILSGNNPGTAASQLFHPITTSAEHNTLLWLDETVNSWLNWPVVTGWETVNMQPIVQLHLRLTLTIVWPPNHSSDGKHPLFQIPLRTPRRVWSMLVSVFSPRLEICFEEHISTSLHLYRDHGPVVCGSVGWWCWLQWAVGALLAVTRNTELITGNHFPISRARRLVPGES